MKGANFSARESLIRLAQFFFKRESEEYRENFQESIIEYAIYLSNNMGINFQTLTQVIMKEFRIEIPDLIIEDILKRCIEKGKVIFKDSKYFLSKERYDLIRRTIEERTKILRKMEKNVITVFYRNYPGFPKNQENIILSSVYRVFARICISNVRIIVSILRPEIMLSENEITPISVLLEHLSRELKTKDEKFNYALRKTLQDIFINKEFSEILTFMMENYLLIELSNLDPDLHILERKLLQKRVLILDTNVLISSIIESDPYHEVTVNLVNLMKQLKVNMAYTERTKEELYHTLDTADRIYRKLMSKIIKESILENLDNIYVKDFYEERLKNPSLTWDGYRLTLKNKLEEYLTSLGIQLFKVEQFSIYENLFEYVKNCVREAGLQVGNIKDLNVAEHDAYHILLIRKLRETEEKDPLGPLTWFVTYDTTLCLVDRKLNEHLHTTESHSSIEVNVWLSFITPFVPISVEEKELPELYSKLMQTTFAVSPIKLDPKSLIEIAGPWLNYESLSVEDIYKILNDISIRNLLERIDNARKRNLEEQANELKRELYVNVETKVAEQINERVTKLENEIGQIKREQKSTSYKLVGFAIFSWILIILIALSWVKDYVLSCVIIFLSFLIILFLINGISYVKAKFLGKVLEVEIKK